MGRETLPSDDIDESISWVGDSGLFIAYGRQPSNKCTTLELSNVHVVREYYLSAAECVAHGSQSRQLQPTRLGETH
mgnify:CR=1 FL=1